MSADGIPGNIVVTRTLTGAIEDTVAVATPVDNLFSRFQTRFDVTSADQGMTVNYYFLDLPALSIAQGSAFTAELDVYYDRGNGGWVQYPLDCQF